MNTLPKIETQTYELNGTHYVEDIVPPGWVVIDTYHPHSCPWDYYGGKHIREYLTVLEMASIPAVPLYTRKTILHPIGTGHNGYVRFGDDMRPGVFSVAVSQKDVTSAEIAICEHKEAIMAWLDNKGPMPEAIR
jgi:hypothetical protein